MMTLDDIVKIRPFCAWAAIEIEGVVERNDARGKGPWETADLSVLFQKLNEEMREVECAICNNGKPIVCEENRTKKAVKHLQDELFDVAATAAMIAARLDQDMSKLRRGRLVDENQ